MVVVILIEFFAHLVIESVMLVALIPSLLRVFALEVSFLAFLTQHSSFLSSYRNTGLLPINLPSYSYTLLAIIIFSILSICPNHMKTLFTSLLFYSLHNTQLPNLCFWYFIRFPITQQIPKVTHLQIPNPRCFLLQYH